MLIPYAAPAEPFHKETEIKKSIFIAHLVPVNSEEEAQKTLEGFRKQYKDATHNCYAWRIGTERVMEKSGDDGEPSGTAGHPMLHVLQMQKLTNLLAVVTRYFGGIKLGAGGLTRAYSSTLADAVKEAPIVLYTPHVRYRLTIPYGALEALKIISRIRTLSSGNGISPTRWCWNSSAFRKTGESISASSPTSPVERR